MKKFLSAICFCMFFGIAVINAQNQAPSIGDETSCSASRTCFDRNGRVDGSVSCSGGACKRIPGGVECDHQVTRC